MTEALPAGRATGRAQAATLGEAALRPMTVRLHPLPLP